MQHIITPGRVCAANPPRRADNKRVSSPQCTRCPHLAKQHNLDGDGKCRVKILTGWSSEKQQYLSSRPCDCLGYQGLDPAHACACEFVSTSPLCVHCGKVWV